MHPRSLLTLKLLLLAAIAAEGCDVAPTTATATEPCPGAESLLSPGGLPTGFERCADGAVNRVEALAVPADGLGHACTGGTGAMECSNDNACTDGPRGQCVGDWTEADDTGEARRYSCVCQYHCEDDSDCEADEACVSSWVTDTHIPAFCAMAECRTGEDCPERECGLSAYSDGCDVGVSLLCRDAETDTCRVDEDCPKASQSCGWDYQSPEFFACQTPNCAIGRPLLVEGGPRLAHATSRADWSEAASASPDGAPDAADAPNDAQRAALAVHWRAVAAAEHASIGSFARFTLQLLALGAPSELLFDTQTAAADEVRHARIAYGFASRYAGVAVGPGPLPLHGAMPALDAPGVLAGLIDEACVGETVGAAEAGAAAAACRDPQVRSALLSIATDESRHAALAWRAVQWLVNAHPELRAFAAERFTTAVSALRSAPCRVPALDLAAHGVLAGQEKQRLREAALREVVEPLGAACFGPAATSA